MKEMIIKARKDWFFKGVFLIISVLNGWIAFEIWLDTGGQGTAIVLGFLPLALVQALFVWMFLSTHYRLENGRLYYRSGPVSGSIALEEIREARIGENLWVGLRPATALGGVVLKYKRYDEIYLSPEDNERFCAHLLAHNPEVKISHKKVRAAGRTA